MVSQALVESLAGGAGAVGSLLLTYPLKSIYTLQALSGGKGRAALSILEVIKKYRLTGLYVGLEPNILESAVSSTVYFYFYASLKRAVISRRAAANAGAENTEHSKSTRSSQDLSVLESMLVAALAGAGNQLLTMPASVVTTRMQANSKQKQESGRADVPSGVLQVARTIHAEDGLGGFWKGLLPSMVLLVNPALQYTVYEQLTALLRRLKARRQAAAAAKSAAGTSSAASTNTLPDQPHQDGSDLPTAADCTAGVSHPANCMQPAQQRQHADVTMSITDGPPAASNSPSTCTAPASATAAAAVACSPSTACCPAPPSTPPLPSSCSPSPSSSAASLSSPSPSPPQPQPTVTLSASEVFLASALAKVVATVITYPMIVVKSRLQATSSTAAGVPQSTWGIISALLVQEGPGGFFAGLRAKILQTALNAALMLMFKEQGAALVKRLLAGGGPKQANLMALVKP